MDAGGTLEMTALGNISRIVQTVNGENATSLISIILLLGVQSKPLQLGLVLRFTTGALGSTDVLNLVMTTVQLLLKVWTLALNVETFNIDIDTGALMVQRQLLIQLL